MSSKKNGMVETAADVDPIYAVASSPSEPSSSHVFVSRSATPRTRISFKTSDEFFHGMLSYRVRTEGPSDKGGNNLARLIYEACCSEAVDSKHKKNEMKGLESLQHFSQVLGRFGKWPKAFSGQSEPIRIFLDQVNLRMGVPWKGTGDSEDGGFLGAVSQTLLMVPLLSATPALFKVMCTDSSESSQRYAVTSSINMKLTDGTEILSIQIDQATGARTIRGHSCENVQIDGSFRLTAVPENFDADFPSKFEFCSTTNFLPSDGSGPRGSLADLLTIQQKPEDLTFSVISASEGHAILQVDQFSDHVFFPNEWISLCVSNTLPSGTQSGSGESFQIVQVVCQGSKAGAVLSKIKIKVSFEYDCFISSASPIPGNTTEDDRCDNVLMELMLCRALRTLSASGNLHPCKLIMPVFVDDMDMLYPLMERLSEKSSDKTSAVVQKALEAILKRKMNLAEEGEWINISVKAVVKFYFDFQGLQLSDKANRYKSMKEKASLVRMHIVTTAGIEANNNALFQYVSNNPLAHELLNFLDSCGLLHLHPVLVKHDITSVKEFSVLSQNAIEKIADDGHALSTRPLMKETVEICCAVGAAQSSKLSWPVSKRLELFEDKEASFLTVIYSSYAIYLALQKPFFSYGVTLLFFGITFGTGIWEVYVEPVLWLPYILPNLARAAWLFFAFFFMWGMNSTRFAFRAWCIGSFTTGASYVIGCILDKIVNGKIELGDSKDCASNFSPQLYATKYASCVYYKFAYFGFNAACYWALWYCLLCRQNIVWRCLTVGLTVQLIMATYIDSTTGTMTTWEIVGCIFVPCVLAVTETLRVYGTLQALQVTKEDSISNAKRWKQAIAESSQSRQHFEQMAKLLNASFNHTILDRSSDMGKWISPARVTKKPPPIRQPIKDFDELYYIACVFNNTFQLWIESFFGSEIPSAIFLHFDENVSVDHLHQHLRFKTFNGLVSRGPVKLPERAIAKVTYLCISLVALVSD